MFYWSLFKQKRESVIVVGFGIFFCALLWALTQARPPRTWRDVYEEKETVEQEIRRAEEMLAGTTDQAQADKLRFRIAELSLSIWENSAKTLEHLQNVSDATTDTERLCSLLWRAASRLQMPGRYTLNWQGADWDHIKPAYEEIVRLTPESDLARRALYQLGHYYLAQNDFHGWRANREEFIRRFGDKKPFYALVAGKEIADSLLFDGNVSDAQKQYEEVLHQLAEKGQKSLDVEINLRLLQTSWLKSTLPYKVCEWKQGLENGLGFGEFKDYDVSGWLEQLLKENQDKALSIPLSQWSECKELWPYDFEGRFYKGLFDHAVPLRKHGLFDWLSRKVRTRKKVARVKADLRTIATALEAYLVDWCGGYPPVKAGGLRILAGMPALADSKGRRPDNDVSVYLERRKETITYLRLVPFDPFAKNPGDFYHYHGRINGWILVSLGPDGNLEIDLLNDYDDRIAQPTSKLLIKSYDPTNGTFSAGDIFRVKQ